jgi:hypothetical protein
VDQQGLCGGIVGLSPHDVVRCVVRAMSERFRNPRCALRLCVRGALQRLAESAGLGPLRGHPGRSPRWSPLGICGCAEIVSFQTPGCRCDTFILLELRATDPSEIKGLRPSRQSIPPPLPAFQTSKNTFGVRRSLPRARRRHR